MSDIRTYSELIKLPTIEDRFKYLKLSGEIGKRTFGGYRWLNQDFYTSREWRSLRDYIFVRDNGCDLASEGYTIHGSFVIHHMNPILDSDIRDQTKFLLDPEFLITTVDRTHKAIHYGDIELLPEVYKDRRPGDTRLW